MANPSAGPSGTSRNEVTALIRTFSCMYTPDVVKKAKKWHDGFVRLHHFNGKAYLVDEASQNNPEAVALAEVFVRPPSHFNASSKGQSKAGLSTEFGWAEGDEVEFDDPTGQRYLAIVEKLVKEESKDLTSALDPAVRRAAVEKRKAESIKALDDYINPPKAGDNQAGEGGWNGARSTGSKKWPGGMLLEESPAAKMMPKNDAAPYASRAFKTHIGSARPATSSPSIHGVAAGSRPTVQSRDLAPPRGSTTPTGLRLETSQHTAPSAQVDHVPAREEGGPEPPKKRVKRLGTTRPSSVLARKSLTLDWASFMDGQHGVQP